MTKVIQIKQTRIQREKRLLIQKAALQVFSEFGLRGATLDKIAKACGYFRKWRSTYGNTKICSKKADNVQNEKTRK